MRSFIFLMVFALLVVAGVSTAHAQGATQPLVLENADRMEGARLSEEYVLTGNVRFRHGELRLETRRALWRREKNQVVCEDGMRVTHRGSLLTADRGSYDRDANLARAEGNVFMRDSAGEVEASGRRLVYNRVTGDAVLSGAPMARRFYSATEPDPDDASSAGRAADTLTIRGNRLTYNDSMATARAVGDVVITRRDLRITASEAEYRQREDSLFLSGSPVAQVEDSEVRGLFMRLALDGETLRSLRVRGEAEALSFEAATDTSRARQSRVTGDSLLLAFRDGGVDSVEVFDSAEGTYWEPERPDYVNRMLGDYMVLRFRDRQAREAEVLGSARSTYYHFEEDTLKGRNRAEGDTIQFGFREGKVEEVLVKGRARGVYEGIGLGGADTVGRATGVAR